MIKKSTDQVIFDFLKKLLSSETAGTQDDICHALSAAGFPVNQSKVSRLLRKIGAIKTFDSYGFPKYSLPKEGRLPYNKTPLRDLVVTVHSNEYLIVIKTVPGSASVIARVVDESLTDRILGSVAGDDTVFVTPLSVADTSVLEKRVKEILTF
ncbi:MAG: arginine repressor [Victivallaceae bacterium]